MHTGRRPASRLRLATTFFAKAIYNLPTTRHLIQRLQTDPQLRWLCGWDSMHQIPAEATFLRAFAEFAAAGLPAQIHAARGKKHRQKRTNARQRGPRLRRQQHMTLKEMIADLPQECSLGAKNNS